MMRLRLRVRREQREVVARTYPGLAHAPRWPTVATFSTRHDLSDLSGAEMRRVLEEYLDDNPQVVRQDADAPTLEAEEYVSLVRDTSGGGTVWEGTITVPEHLRG